MSNSNNNLMLDQIETVRQKLLMLADEKGVTHEETLTISQKLDYLLNEYQGIKG